MWNCEIKHHLRLRHFFLLLGCLLLVSGFLVTSVSFKRVLVTKRVHKAYGALHTTSWLTAPMCWRRWGAYACDGTEPRHHRKLVSVPCVSRFLYFWVFLVNSHECFVGAMIPKTCCVSGCRSRTYTHCADFIKTGSFNFLKLTRSLKSGLLVAVIARFPIYCARLVNDV